MDIFTEIKSALLGMPAVTALVGGTNSETVRIWNSWQRVNGRGSEPCIIMDSDDEVDENDLSGSGGLVIAEMTVTCRANSHAQSEALCQAVKLNGTAPGTGLAGYPGTFDAICNNTQHVRRPRATAAAGTGTTT